jgi:hypothetical protein
MSELIQQFAGQDLQHLHNCWSDLRDTLQCDDLFDKLQLELQQLPENTRARLRESGRFGSGEWINTACQLLGSAGRCTTSNLGAAMEITRTVILMYTAYVYLRESCIQQWRDALGNQSHGQTRDILNILLDDRFRRIRNAVSHANWFVSDDGQTITFVDQRPNGEDRWTKTETISSVMADCLIVCTLMTALSGVIVGAEETE